MNPLLFVYNITLTTKEQSNHTMIFVLHVIPFSTKILGFGFSEPKYNK